MKQTFMRLFVLPASISLLFLFLFLSIKGKSSVSALEPGSANDPVVTKSYVNDLFGWKVHTLYPGEFTTFEVGTEAVLRSGKGIIVAGSGGGLADLTSGHDLKGGSLVPLNHLLLAPSSDGRGIRAETTVVFLAKGWLP